MRAKLIGTAYKISESGLLYPEAQGGRRQFRTYLLDPPAYYQIMGGSQEHPGGQYQTRLVRSV